MLGGSYTHGQAGGGALPQGSPVSLRQTPSGSGSETAHDPPGTRQSAEGSELPECRVSRACRKEPGAGGGVCTDLCPLCMKRRPHVGSRGDPCALSCSESSTYDVQRCLVAYLWPVASSVSSQFLDSNSHRRNGSRAAFNPFHRVVMESRVQARSRSSYAQEPFCLMGLGGGANPMHPNSARARGAPPCGPCP